MIGDIRKSLQSRGIKLLIWLTLASLMAGTVSMFIRYPGKSLDESVALVNGYDVGIMEFRRKFLEVENMVHEIKQVYGTQAPMVLKMWGFDRPADEIVLDEMIGEKIMKSATDALGARANHEYVQRKLRDPYFVRQYLGGLIPPQAFRDGSLDIEVLHHNLKRQGISEEDFDELLEDALMRAFFFTLIEGGLYMPDTLLKDAYISRFLKKKYAYFMLPMSKYVTKAREHKATAGEIEKFYGQPEQKETYRIPEKRSAKVWTFTPEGFGIIFKDEDLKSAYESRKKDFIKKPAEVDVQHILITFTEADKLTVRGASQEILKQVKADPKKFSELAAQHSQSKDKGTTITVKRTDKNRVFTNAAFGLRKDEVAGVIETPEGFEIIKLIEKREPQFKTLDEVKDELSKKLKDEKFQRLFDTQAQRILSQARDVPTVLTSFIEQHKGQQSTITDVVNSEKVLNERLFNLRKVGDRGFYQDEGKGVIIELTELKKSLVPQLDSIQAKVENNFYEKRAQELLKKDISIAVDEIRNGKKTFAQVAQGFGATPELTNWVSMDDQASFKKLQDLKLNLPEITQLTKEGSVVGDVNDVGGYIIELKQMDPFEQNAFEEKKSALRVLVAPSYKQNASGSLIQALRSNADVQVNTSNLRTITRK